MEYLKILGAKKLSGEVSISGAKKCSFTPNRMYDFSKK